MPTYVYRCKNCEKEIEVFDLLAKNIKAPNECKFCKGKEFNKVLHTAGTHYKGDGFYSTRKD